jgi:NADPH:quinone reductase
MKSGRYNPAMKVIRVHNFGGPEVLKLEDVPDPTPGGGQVLIKVYAIGVNPVETYIRAGRYGPKEFPFIPGADCAGVVEAIGPGVTRLKVGDRVYSAGSVSGTYAEKSLCPEARVFKLPAKVSFAQGAALGIPYGTAHRALFHRAQAKAGETILVHGASGGVGLAAVQLGHRAKMKVLGTAGSDEGLKLVHEQGADAVFNHKDTGYVEQIKSATAGRGVDVILEMLANVNLDKDLGMLAKNGRVIVIGSRGRIEIDPRDTMSRDADIRGMTLMNATDADLAQMHTDIIAGLEDGSLNPIIDVEIPLSEATRAHEEVMAGNSRGKIVLIP